MCICPHMLTGVPTPMDTIHATVSTPYQLHVVSLDLSMTFDLRRLSGSPAGLSLLLKSYTLLNKALLWGLVPCLVCVCVRLCGKDTHKEKQWLLGICKSVYEFVCSCGVPRTFTKARFNTCVHFIHRQTGKVGLLCSSFPAGWSAAMLCLAYSMYPCCKDNDVMNGESKEESGRKREWDFKANAWGMSNKPVYV